MKNTKAQINLSGGVTVTQTGSLARRRRLPECDLVASGEKLTGNVVADSTSTATVTLKGGSTLRGTIIIAALTLSGTSTPGERQLDADHDYRGHRVRQHDHEYRW